jgi:hypothetical protein
MGFDINNEFYRAFLLSMQNRGLRYMLIGGVAVNFHGLVRNTQDMDVWLAPTNWNRDLFYQVLLDLGYTEDEITEYKDVDFTEMFKCSIGETPYSIDCLTYVHPQINFDEAEKAMLQHHDNELVVNFVDFDFLRKMKVITHREKDWYDVIRLDELKKKP